MCMVGHKLCYMFPLNIPLQKALPIQIYEKLFFELTPKILRKQNFITMILKWEAAVKNLKLVCVTLF